MCTSVNSNLSTDANWYRCWQRPIVWLYCRCVRVLLFSVLHVHAGDGDERVCSRSVLLRPLVRHRHAHQSSHHVRHQGERELSINQSIDRSIYLSIYLLVSQFIDARGPIGHQRCHVRITSTNSSERLTFNACIASENRDYVIRSRPNSALALQTTKPSRLEVAPTYLAAPFSRRW